MAGVIAVITPEKRIEKNPYDVEAWNLLLRDSQVGFTPNKFFLMSAKFSGKFRFFFQRRPIEQVRTLYEKLILQFPNAGRFWKCYIEHEVSFRPTYKIFTPLFCSHVQKFESIFVSKRFFFETSFVLQVICECPWLQKRTAARFLNSLFKKNN